jgi:preprotein translocase subunit SecE
MSNQSIQTVSTSNDKIKVILAVIAVVAGVVGFYFLSDKTTLIRVLPLLAGLLIGIGLMATASSGKEFMSFAQESIRETKKVVWPTPREAAQITAIVFGFVLIMAIFLWGADKFLEFLLYHVILGWK